MKNYSTYDVADFVSDSAFVIWVIAPDAQSSLFWNNFIQKNPSQKANISEARFLVKSLKGLDKYVSQDRLDLVWEKVTSNIDKSKKLRIVPYLSAAAIFFLVVSFGIIAYDSISKTDYSFTAERVADDEEATLFLADGSSKALVTSDTDIELNKAGQIIVNNDTIKIEQKQDKAIQLNHVVMPYGKQTFLQLPDGTTVHINAGSRLSFPSKFSGTKREVYLVGEALFDVEKNKQKPFIVHTQDMDITVTGTEFNVSAYVNDDFTQTVLVSGLVQVSKNTLFSKKTEIVPGECASFNKTTGEINTSKVNANNITSWVKGYLIFEEEPASNVFVKLERFYDKEIAVGRGVQEFSFSGKLNLSEDLDKVLETISFASSVRVVKSNRNKNKYIIKR